MLQKYNAHIQEENEMQKIYQLISRNYYLFLGGILLGGIIAFFITKYSIPVYKITSSILIKEDGNQTNMGDVINSNLFGTNQNLQNELLLIQSVPVLTQTIKNLDLPVNYYYKKDFMLFDGYKTVPFKVMYLRNHLQPIGARFQVSFEKNNRIKIKADAKKVRFYNFEENRMESEKSHWSFESEGKPGELIENNYLSFIIQIDSAKTRIAPDEVYYFDFTDIPTITNALKSQLEFKVLDMEATAIEISLKTKSVEKGTDIVNSITNVYSNNNLEKKNHLASITIDYIDNQLGKISDSLISTEKSLQSFKSLNQLLNVTEQSNGITNQYRELENQRAELITRKRYYEYVSDYLAHNEDFTNMIIPASLGIQDQLLNSLTGNLITAQAQKTSLIENNQEKNPLVKKLSIEIENIKKTISENINYGEKTTEISLEELDKRISKIEAEISRMPHTELQLTGIERKYRLNETIYNYLMQKRAEANISRASNLPGNEIIEQAKIVGNAPVSPNKNLNYALGIILGLILPFVYLQIRASLNNKIENQDQIERITDIPILGKILHNVRKSDNVVYDFPNSSIAESFRTLRTNLDYYVRGNHKKTIMVSSCIEGEGKSFNALNIAMSYAQFNRKTILLDFDLRKPGNYFHKKNENLIGLSSFLINKAVVEDIIIKTPHEYLDYIPSGPVPPNPVELIGLEKTAKLINQLKEEYDYIILDTPPLAQVTDAYLLIEHADIKIIVARYNFTVRRIFSFIMKDLHQKNIDNVCIVLNDNHYFGDQYGYGYGYNSTKNGKRSKNYQPSKVFG